jgi:hypothetical protein
MVEIVGFVNLPARDLPVITVAATPIPRFFRNFLRSIVSLFYIKQYT